ncbi:hypothetical protein ACW9HQ_46960, partial [Nocardia gipuzkoensis]
NYRRALGIINMMIVVPMLIESLTFGAVYKHTLDDNSNNMIIVAGGLLACAALAMAWIKQPRTSHSFSR